MTGPTARLLALLSLLQARRDWPGPLLAERLEISERTVRRDVDRLRDLGYRVEAAKGPDGGYRLDAGRALPPLLFDDEQAVALTVLLQTASSAVEGLEEAATRALTTVRQVLPPRLRQRIDGLQVAAVAPSSTAATERVDAEVLVELSRAVRAREVLRFRYDAARHESSAGPPVTRRVEPHHVVTSGGRWYLVAWDLQREDWRTFRVDRITPVVPTGPGFTPRALPGGDVHTFVAGRFKGSVGVDEWPCRGEAVLRVRAADVAPYVREGVVETLEGDRCRVELGAWSWVGLAARICALDAEVEQARPAELRAAFGRLSGRCAGAAG